MKANEVEPRTWDEGRQALQEFQRAHHQMGGAIAVRGFELQHDLAGRGAAGATAGSKPSPFSGEGHQLFMGAFPTSQAQKPMR